MVIQRAAVEVRRPQDLGHVFEAGCVKHLFGTLLIALIWFGRRRGLGLVILALVRTGRASGPTATAPVYLDARAKRAENPERGLKRRSGTWRRTAVRLALTLLAILSGSAAYAVGIWATVPGIGELTPFDARTDATERREGLPITRLAPEIRIPIAWGDIPASLRNATVAIEDERFYDHGAIDLHALARAAAENVKSGSARQGASTIAQQLARTLYLSNHSRSLKRKIWETKLAVQLGKRHSKRWILWRYLNSVPYGAVNGRTITGVEAAALAFFSTRARNLTLPEAALIAGMAQAPSDYDPFEHPEAATKRRNVVLAKMAELGLISPRHAAVASTGPIALSACGSPPAAAQPAPEALAPVAARSPPRRGGPSQAIGATLAALMREGGPASGAFVLDATARQTLFSWNADTARALGSNTKLFIGAAVLAHYSPTETIRTRLFGTGSLEHGVWTGDLYLRGGGDPNFASAPDGVDDLVRELRKRGIRRIRGRVVGDESLFDSRRGGPDSGWRTSIFVGPLSALSINRGKPSSPFGAFGSNPPAAAAHALDASLERVGIAVSGEAAADVTPERAQPLASVQSAPLGDLVWRMEKSSDSFTAEMLTKKLAAHVTGGGSTGTGVRVAARFARSLGVDVRLADGSGLCRHNRSSPRDVVRLLDRLRERRRFTTLLNSLPIAGWDGSLHGRMRQTPAAGRCRAKTGTLLNVSNLSGWCRTEAGHTIVLSFLMNDVDVLSARRLQDQMLQSVVCHGATGSSHGRKSSPPVVPIIRGGPRRMMALTFDDGPSPYTRRIISVLRREHAPATFFQTGRALSASRAIDRRDLRYGITVANHANSHRVLSGMSETRQREEILSTAREIRRTEGSWPRLFRPPYIAYDAVTARVLSRLGMKMVLFTSDTQDFRRDGVEAIVRRAMIGASPGAIVLMHDGGGNRAQTVAALPRIIDGLRKRGYRLVSVPTLLRENPPQQKPMVPFTACSRYVAPGMQLAGGER